METECNSKQFEFEDFGNRKVVGSFDGGALTSDAGAVLLREADQAIALAQNGGRILVRRARSEMCPAHKSKVQL